uniref:Probable purine permease n=1 Tax=Anthurium amnicola TaxID=1678845 RepID=A0A1D1Y2H5_9ARAE
MGVHQEEDATRWATRRRWRWWLTVALNIVFLVAGQTAATLLGRLYYDEGGNSKWMATLVQSAGFPILVLAYFFFPSQAATPARRSGAGPMSPRPSAAVLALVVYVPIGLLVAGDNLMYSYGLLYLPVSTYSLICATQLGFNAVFARLLNAQRFTPLVLNSVVLLTFSAALLGIRSPSGEPAGVEGRYALGFVLTLGASAAYSLILSLMQLSFQRVLKRETFSVVLEMQVFTSAVAACASVVGLFASGEWGTLRGEMEGYRKGEVSYVMTLVWTAVGWQVASVGVVGLVFQVSSLFSNVISTLALPVVPIFAVAFFGDKMDGEKVLAMLLGIWGFLSYLYQHYLDDQQDRVVELQNKGGDGRDAEAPPPPGAGTHEMS